MERLDAEQVRRGCTRFLAYHYPLTPQQQLRQLADAAPPELESDRYGTGALISSFEAEIAALLGTEAAVFLPSGTMAQQIALRIWSERKGRPRVAFHPTAHLEIHEAHGYRELHGLHGVLVGGRERLMTLEDLQQIAEPLAALLIELPQREIGGVLPTWDELTAICAWARERGIALHLDGARLWECQPFYQRPYAEIAALFDTVYVSFYKILGGTAGAALAGPADIIAQAKVWQHRHGGRLPRIFPEVLSARLGLETRLERIERYCAHARATAAAFATLPGVVVQPEPPHTNMFHLYLPGNRERLEQAALQVASESGVWLFATPRATQLATYQLVEYTAGDASLDVPPQEAAALLRAVLERAAVSGG